MQHGANAIAELPNDNQQRPLSGSLSSPAPFRTREDVGQPGWMQHSADSVTDWKQVSPFMCQAHYFLVQRIRASEERSNIFASHRFVGSEVKYIAVLLNDAQDL
jgi:hypothetical protein